jgi:hypothetical protein
MFAIRGRIVVIRRRRWIVAVRGRRRIVAICRRIVDLRSIAAAVKATPIADFLDRRDHDVWAVHYGRG